MAGVMTADKLMVKPGFQQYRVFGIQKQLAPYPNLGSRSSQAKEKSWWESSIFLWWLDDVKPSFRLTKMYSGLAWRSWLSGKAKETMLLVRLERSFWEMLCDSACTYVMTDSHFGFVHMFDTSPSKRLRRCFVSIFSWTLPSGRMGVRP